MTKTQLNTETTYSKLTSGQLDLIEESLNSTINQLDFLGSEVEQVKEFQKVRDHVNSLKEKISNNENIDNNDSEYYSDIPTFKITGEEPLHEMSFKLKFNTLTEVVSLDTIINAISWLENPALFSGIEDLAEYTTDNDEEQTPTLVLTRVNKRQLAYFSLIDMYRTWQLCLIIQHIEPSSLEHFSYNIEECLDQVYQSIYYLKEIFVARYKDS